MGLVSLDPNLANSFNLIANPRTTDKNSKQILTQTSATLALKAKGDLLITSKNLQLGANILSIYFALQ